MKPVGYEVLEAASSTAYDILFDYTILMRNDAAWHAIRRPVSLSINQTLRPITSKIR